MRRIYIIAAAALLFAACNNTTKNPEPEPTLFDFESVEADYLAGPTSYGGNLYDGFEGEQFTFYTDVATGLTMRINETGGVYNFYNGGVAISQWNDMTAEGYTNQCSVYFKDATTGFGGYGGSKTFAVVNYSAFNDRKGEIFFAEASDEAAFDHFWVTNNTYAALSMANGDEMGAKKFELGDWFLMTVTAEDKDGLETGTPVKFYLADFRTASSPGIVTNWTKVDLTPLGERVHKLLFSLSSSDNSDWGAGPSMNTPGYFCFDNLAFFK